MALVEMVGRELSETLLNVAVANAALLWAVMASPAWTVEPSATVLLPIAVQLRPSVLE